MIEQMFISQSGIDGKDSRCMNWNEYEEMPQYSNPLSVLITSIVLGKTETAALPNE